MKILSVNRNQANFQLVFYVYVIMSFHEWVHSCIQMQYTQAVIKVERTKNSVQHYIKKKHPQFSHCKQNIFIKNMHIDSYLNN